MASTSYERESTFSHPPSPETASGTSISSGSPVDHAITYSFSQSSPNSMVVVPTDYPDAHPAYHISVQVNCFFPLSNITTVRRGGTEEGDFVGDFELGITSDHSTVCIRDTETYIFKMLSKKGSRVSAKWMWRSQGSDPLLIWDFRSLPATCRLGSSSSITLAHFSPVRTMRRPGHPVVLPYIEVHPAGQHLFDDILMSLLIIERKRRVPITRSSAEESRGLFN